MALAESVGLYFVDEGDGPPVVFAHGFGLTHELWAEQRELSDEFRVIAYDARGCGCSPAAGGRGFGYPDLATDLLGLMDALELERAHFVGHAVGGGAMVHAALREPDRAASLFLMESALDGFPWSDEFVGAWERCAVIVAQQGFGEAARDEWLDSGMYRWVRSRRPDVFERVAAMTDSWAGAEWLEPFPYAGRDECDLERLAELQVPLFVLSGQEDLHDFVEIANMLGWWVRGALQRSLLGVGHFPMLENPPETNLYLRGFLRKMAGRM
jgi:3-oxoadipate enol-lactonase